MNKAEPLCDLRFVKAEYRLARATDETPSGRKRLYAQDLVLISWLGARIKRPNCNLSRFRARLA
jgi:hypothetical protein